ncbi:MAG: SelB C-terminal domain-containing protein, partial [Anaerolineae bacterium]
NEDVAFSAATYQELLAAVKQIIQQEGSVTVAQVRDRFNTSRKYALALLEYLDSIRVTRRVGDARVLR